jgi:hypothetical protein
LLFRRLLQMLRALLRRQPNRLFRRAMRSLKAPLLDTIPFATKENHTPMRNLPKILAVILTVATLSIALVPPLWAACCLGGSSQCCGPCCAGSPTGCSSGPCKPAD